MDLIIPQQQAEISTGVMLALAVASAVGSYLLRPRNAKSNDNSSQTYKSAVTTRGAQLKLQIGLERVKDPIFNWVGGEFSRQESSGGSRGGGKGLGGGGRGANVETIYYESASILLSVGPGQSLNKIIIGGEVLWEGPIDRFNTPSGSSVTTSRGVFVIYWGEIDGPVDEYLADPSRIGIRSRWPLYFRIRWIDFKKGPSRQWPDIKFETDVLAGSSLQRSPQFIPQTDDVYANSGPNPAHAAFQVLTAAWPHGAGLTQCIDQNALEETGLVCLNESTPCRVLAEGDDTAADVISRLCTDFGWMIVQDGDRLLIRALRAASYYPAFDDDLVVSPAPSRLQKQGDRATDRTVFLFTDRASAFTQVPVRFDDDGENRQWNRRRQIDTVMPYITDKITATKSASRRVLEQFSDQNKIEVQLPFTARALIPGSPFSLEGRGNLRVVSIQKDVETAINKISAVSEAFLTEDSGYLGVTSSGSQSSGPPVADLIFAAYELPYLYVGQTIALGVLRVRGNSSVGPASVWTSLDGTTYANPGEQRGYAIGGSLVSTVSEDRDPILEQGPTVSMYNDDVRDALDLSGDVSGWLNGRQMALIDDELFFVKKLTPVGPSPLDYRLDGLVSATSGTVKSRHIAGSPVFVFLQNAINPITDPSFTVGSRVRVKTQPSGVDLDEVIEDIETIDGLARAPFPVHNLGCIRRSYGEAATILSASGDTVVLAGNWTRQFKVGFWIWIAKDYGVTHKNFYAIKTMSLSVSGETTLTLATEITHTVDTDDKAYAAMPGARSYVSGQDAVLSWTFSNRFLNGQAAGEQGYGAALSSIAAPREGSFLLEIRSFSGAAAIRTATIDSDHPEFRYTEDMRTLDFGSANPDNFTVRVRNVLGAYSSQWLSVRVIKE